MNSLRILLVSNTCPPDYDGGYELRAFQIAGALRARGHRVDLVTSRYRDTFRGERVDPDWVHRVLHYVLVSASTTAWRYVDRVPRRIACTTVASHNVPAMARFLTGRDYDVAYCFGLQRVSLAAVAPIVQRGIPILWHAGDGYLADHFHDWPRRRPGYAWGLQLFARKWYSLEKSLDYRRVAFVSEFLKEECRQKGFVPEKAFVISRGFDGPLGRDVDRARTAPPLFFMACRIDPQKGIHDALAAAGQLLARRPELPWRLEIAGPALSGYGQQMEALVERLGLRDRVQFLGQLSRDRVLARMRSATAFLSCSTYGEPFAGTIIETLALGTPLIGADAGSIREVATDGRSALIYPIGDAAKLSQHMETVLLEPAFSEALAAEGVRVIEARYTLDRILAQTEAVLAECVADRPTVRPEPEPSHADHFDLV